MSPEAASQWGTFDMSPSISGNIYIMPFNIKKINPFYWTHLLFTESRLPDHYSRWCLQCNTTNWKLGSHHVYLTSMTVPSYADLIFPYKLFIPVGDMCLAIIILLIELSE
jgi:hypothetical protein